MVFFAAAEMALLTVRKTQLKTLAKSGEGHTSSVLQIHNNHGDFLSTVQIEINRVGTAASAIGGVRAMSHLAPRVRLEPGL